MVGKIIRIKDPGLIKFFYPNFFIRSEITYPDRDCNVIYNGPMRRNLISYLESNTKSFISTTGSPDLDFENREELLKWIFKKKGKDLTPKIVEGALSVEDNYFLESIKLFWILEKWRKNSSQSDITLYDLFSKSVEPLKDLLVVYFNLLEVYPAPVIESSFITFLSRVKNIEEQSVKPGYMKLLKSANTRYGIKIKSSIYKMASREGIRDELVMLDLLTDLR